MRHDDTILYSWATWAAWVTWVRGRLFTGYGLSNRVIDANTDRLFS